MKPYISIVTATYNSAQYLQRCIDSVAGQTFQAVEHIVIDGASTDGTAEIIKANEKNLSYWVSETDKGIFEAWNKALPHIKGEWVLFLGSDDCLIGECALEKIVPFLKNASPEYSLVYGILQVCDRGTKTAKTKIGLPWENMEGKYSKANIALPPHPATFHHFSVFINCYTFDEKFQIAADSKLMTMEIIKKRPLFVPVEITYYSLGGISGSLGKRQLKMWIEERKISKEYDVRIPKKILFFNFLKCFFLDVSGYLFKEKGVRFFIKLYSFIRSFALKWRIK